MRDTDCKQVAQRATHLSLPLRTALISHLISEDLLTLDSKRTILNSQCLVLAIQWVLTWHSIFLDKTGWPKRHPLCPEEHCEPLWFLWSLAIRPNPWKSLWISNKLNLQESGAIKTEWDNLIPALARQHLDSADYKMSCQFWFWAHTPKQVNPSWFVVPQ